MAKIRKFCGAVEIAAFDAIVECMREVWLLQCVLCIPSNCICSDRRSVKDGNFVRRIKFSELFLLTIDLSHHHYYSLTIVPRRSLRYLYHQLLVGMMRITITSMMARTEMKLLNRHSQRD